MASTKIKVLIPKDLTLQLDGGSDENGNDIEITKEFRFVKDFLIRQVLNDKRWIQDSDWTYAGMEIRGLFKDAKEGETIELTNDQYKKLKEVVEKPSNGWNLHPQVMYQLQSFLDALLHPVKDEETKK